MNDSLFFGRDDYLAILEKRARDLKEGYRQNIAMVGEELVGKTSIIFRFLNRFHEPKIIPVYLEVRPESFELFAKRFLGVLLYNFLSNSDLPLREDLDFLIEKSARYIPRTCDKIKNILICLQKRKLAGLFTELLSLTECIYQETSKSCVVIFDEFHNLETLGIKKLYPEWSKLLLVQKNTLYIIVSSLKFKAQAILAKNLSLLFGNFEVITVESFDLKTSERYLNERLRGLPLDTGLKNFVIHFTGGHPFYLNLIAEELLKSPLTKATLPDIIENLLFSPSGILNQKFSNYLKRFLNVPHSQDYLSVLRMVASGHNRLKEIAHFLRKPQKNILPRINYLLESDTLVRSGEFLTLNDRIFGFWLRFVHQEKLHSLTFNAHRQQGLFRENVEKMISEFLSCAEQPIVERMLELLRLFDDDTIQIEKKKVRLTHFREIKPLEFGRNRIRDGLIGRSSDALWIIAFKNEAVAEEDVVEFARECKRYRHAKLQRKILVTAGDVDPNARLKAMEEKIWTWDLNNVNRILDLFLKPRVIA